MNDDTEKTSDTPPPLPRTPASARPATDQGVPTLSPSMGVDATAAFPPPPPQADPPKRIDRFELVHTLGEGGMGIAYLARDTTNGRDVALKTLNPRMVGNPDRVRDFLREARRMSTMEHPHIVPVLEVIQDSRSPAYVMPYMAGGSLGSRMTPDQPLPVDVVLPLAIQVAEALQYAHDVKGVIHRDVKPQNVLLDDNGRACVSDFGLVRALGASDESIIDPHQPPTWTVGTRSYMAPEIVMGKAGDYRVDVYSFGAMLYELLTGQKPYRGNSVDEVLAQIRQGPPPAVRSVNPHVPENVARVIEGAMARELRDRYSTMSDLLTDLRRLQSGQSPLGPRGHHAPAGAPVIPPQSRAPAVAQAPGAPVAGVTANHAPASRGGSVVPLLLVLALLLGLGVIAAAGWFFRDNIRTLLGYVPSPPPVVGPPPTTTQPESVEDSVRLAEQLQVALRDGDDKQAMEIIQQLATGDKRVNAGDRFGLLMAVRQQRAAVVEYLCSKVRAGLNVTDEAGNTALHIAAMRNDASSVEIIRMLLKTGQLKPVDANVEGKTALHVAADRNADRAADALVTAGADVNARDRGGNTPLHVAAAAGNPAMVEFLLAKGATPTTRNDRRQTPGELATDPELRRRLGAP